MFTGASNGKWGTADPSAGKTFTLNNHEMNHIESTITTPEYLTVTNERLYTSTPQIIIINNKTMNKNQSNTEKIIKLIDKFDTEDFPELHSAIKNHMTEKLLAKSNEYSEKAELLRTQSEKITGDK